MGYERNPRGGDRPGTDNRDREQDYGRDYGSGRDYTYSSARDYAASGQYGRDEGRGQNRDQGGRDQGSRDYYGGSRDQYGSRDQGYNRDQARERNYTDSSSYGAQSGGYGQQYGAQNQGRVARDSDEYRGYRGDPNSRGRGEPNHDNDRGQSQRGRGFSGQPQGYDYEDRGFLNRAGDEVRSWFGDDEAESRRDADRRYDERYGNTGQRSGHDEHYDNWRRKQMSELDRDYHEYRQENSQKFENEFGSFRTERQTQRSSLSRVKEHMEVVGSDDGHVGTVDKVRGDRIILTKNDQDAGGRHHSIPSRWIETVDDKVKIRKTADEAQAQWRDEEANQAFFGENRDEQRGDNRSSSATATSEAKTGTSETGSTNLNRSFPGTY